MFRCYNLPQFMIVSLTPGGIVAKLAQVWSLITGHGRQLTFHTRDCVLYRSNGMYVEVFHVSTVGCWYVRRLRTHICIYERLHSVANNYYTSHTYTVSIYSIPTPSPLQITPKFTNRLIYLYIYTVQYRLNLIDDHSNGRISISEWPTFNRTEKESSVDHQRFTSCFFLPR